MGTSYSFDGKITIDPPLNFVQIRQAQQVALGLIRQGWDKRHSDVSNVFSGYMPLKLDLESFDKDTDEGILKVTRAVGLIPSHPGEGSLSYSMKDLLLKLVQAFPDHKFYGTVVALNEDGVSAVKLSVVSGAGPSEVEQTSGKAFIHWDDQSTSTSVSDLA